MQKNMRAYMSILAEFLYTIKHSCMQAPWTVLTVLTGPCTQPCVIGEYFHESFGQS